MKNSRKLKELLKYAPPKVSGLYPKDEPYEKWVGGRHANGVPVIKYATSTLLSRMKPHRYPIPFDCLNKFQETGWVINKDMLTVFNYAAAKEKKATYDADNAALSYILETDKTARASKRTEVDIIRKMAAEIGDEPFYHQYQFDFRGRVYPTTAFLHEQGSDNAKGLLLLEMPKPLGNHGYKWIKVQAANHLGEDKLRIDDRVAFVDDNMAEFIGYAEQPFVNKKWMTAEYPLQFLATCFELRKIRDWKESGELVENFLSSLVIYFDGSNNGTQWLTAMSRDHESAELVNLLPSEFPGDVYTFISEKVWERVLADYNPEFDEELEKYAGRLQEFGGRVDSATKKTRKEAVTDRSLMRELYRLN